MPESYVVFATLLGGLGLFLVAMEMMTDGLTLAAGQSLRRLLANWTNTLVRGVLSGVLMTAIVQSSSAVTVASLGFVNAELIKMRQALGIIYGANIGTTMTAWLVAIVGFKLDIHAVALPAIGIGAFMMLAKSKGPRLGIGRAMVGFGLFFLGISTLQQAFEGIVTNFDFSTITLEGNSEVIGYLLIGIVMTILTQSSSAAIAITISAASAEMIGIYAAAAMVIGANVGTTSTAVLASIGATSNAKRLATAQVIFNIATAIVALILLPALFYTVEAVRELMKLTPNIGVTLALFHTIFNCLGVLLIIPFNDKMVSFLDARFITVSESLGKPKYLDKSTAGAPVMAVSALILELQRTAIQIGITAKQTIDTNISNHDLDQKIYAIHQLSSAVSSYIVNLERAALSDEVTKQLSNLMKVDQYFLACAGILSTALETRTRLGKLPNITLEKELQTYRDNACKFLNSVTSPDSELYFEKLENTYHQLKSDRDVLKEHMLTTGTKGLISLDQMINAIDFITEIKQLNEHWYKAIKILAHLENETRKDVSDVEELSD
ncbi:Na/Pi symporter [uncultured Zhongshania sp.]|uniref:Na/Pi cotransporter family protein n=1 Tax=uncultured Zhongshania sp. TaxID=1642288 RepID=UPI0030DCA7CB|tara:strand:+ start:15177 stop:16829 length:1653 start_codon:yes stop_codon:yes gene_type:complete